MTEIKHRPIRSYVRREGKITRGQQRALDELGPKYLLPTAGQLDFPAIFGNDRPVVLEIGFGNGLSLAEMAQNDPQRNYLGIEVYRPGVGSLLIRIRERGLTNLRAVQADAVEVLENQIADASLAAAHIYFPDPWHKARHNKRRIIQPHFVQLIRNKLKIGGVAHIATDWEDYAEHIMAVMSAADGFINLAGEGNFSPRPEYRPLTKFEQRGQRLGHGVWDLLFEKT